MRRKEMTNVTMQTYATLQKRIMRRLEEAGPHGRCKSELYRSLSRPVTKQMLDVALKQLQHRGMADARRIETGKRGRPKEIWWIKGSVPRKMA